MIMKLSMRMIECVYQPRMEVNEKVNNAVGK